MQPKVSVIIPVYNVEKYLRQCLNSVVNQTLKDIEIICVDDGSTDNSLKILKEYASKDDRFIILEQKNQGAGAARNKGLEIAQGEYLSFLDSDDFFELDMLEKVYNHSKKYDTDITMFNLYLYDEQAKTNCNADWTLKHDIVKNKDVFNYKDIPDNIFNLSNCWVWNRLYKREFIINKNIKFQSLKCANDTYFSCIAMVKANKISCLKERLLHYRTNRDIKDKNVTSASYRKKSPNDLLYCFYSIYKNLVNMGIYNDIENSYIKVAIEHIYWSKTGIQSDKEAYQTFCKFLVNYYKDIFMKSNFMFTDHVLGKKFASIRNIFLDNKYINEIPKRIFYVWGAGEPKNDKVKHCIDSWKKHLPCYEIIEINENSKIYFNFKKELKNNKWFRTVYQRKMWAYVSDYIRIKTLYDHGGIYFDTDVSVVQNMDNLLKEPAFVGMQSSSLDGYGDYVEPAILGAQKGNKFLELVLDFYNKKIWNEPIYTMPKIFNYYFNKYDIFPFPMKEQQNIIKLNNITIYPEKFFIPFRFRTEYSEDCITPETCTIHWWGGSWVKPEVIEFLENKHRKKYLFKQSIIDTISNIFSIQNIGVHKVISILGIKLKIKSKKLINRAKYENIENRVNELSNELEQLKSIIGDKINV